MALAVNPFYKRMASQRGKTTSPKQPGMSKGLITKEGFEQGQTGFTPAVPRNPTPGYMTGNPPNTSPNIGDYYNPNQDVSTIGQNYADLSSQIASPTIGTIGSAADRWGQSNQPQSITGVSDAAFDEQTKMAREELLDKYFGTGGEWETGMAREGAAGRLGSGVARRMMEQTVTNPFAKAAASLESQNIINKATEKARVEEFNATQKMDYDKTMADLMKLDSSNETERNIAQGNIDIQHQDLLGALSTATTTAELTEIAKKIDAFDVASDDFYKKKSIDLAYVNTTLPTEDTVYKGKEKPKPQSNQTSSAPQNIPLGGTYIDANGVRTRRPLMFG